jgi:hypothetical protein
MCRQGCRLGIGQNLGLRVSVVLVVGGPLQLEDDVDVLDDLVVRAPRWDLIGGALQVHRIHRYGDVLQPRVAVPLHA